MGTSSAVQGTRESGPKFVLSVSRSSCDSPPAGSRGRRQSRGRSWTCWLAAACLSHPRISLRRLSATQM